MTEAGWHVHDNVVLFLTPADVKGARRLAEQAKLRWLTMACADADRTGQEARLWDDSAAAVRYITKGLMIQKQRNETSGAGYTPADVLALWVAGDAQAASWWQELEALFRSPKRFKARGGTMFRGAVNS